jgi:hypothetical protein
LENLSFSLFGELLQLAENLLLAIPDDPIPIYCLPHAHSRRARITDDAAAKLSDLPSIAPNPEDRTVNYFRLPLQLGVIWMVERGLINGNRRQSGNRQREPECVS